MLPVSHAVQASKATQPATSANSESTADQGFAALFAQGLGNPGARAPESAPQADPGPQIQRSPGAATAPPGGEVRRSGGETTAGEANSVATPSSGASPAATGTGDTKGTDSKHSTHGKDIATSEPAPDPAAALLAGLQAVQQAQTASAGRPEAAAAGGAVLRGAGLQLKAGGAGGDDSEVSSGQGIGNGAGAGDFQAQLTAAGSAAGATVPGSTRASAEDAGPVATLGAGLSALLSRQGSSQDAAVGSLWAGVQSSHAARESSSAADAGFLYNQVAQPALQAPTADAALLVAPTLNLAPPIGDERWTAALGQQALFMAKNQLSSAQLTVNPPNLGPIQITLDLKHDQATAVFVSPHDAVRQAIEASLPHLRDMFSAAGLQLGGAQVQSDSAGQSGQWSANQQAFAERRATGSAGGGGGGTAVTLAPAASTRRVAQGLLDTFA